MKPFIYETLADMLVVIHLGYMAYVVFGQLAIMIGWRMHWQWIRNPWFRVSHLAMILIVAVEAIVQFPCPLTTWEIYLRRDIGQMKANPVVDADWDVEDASFTARVARKIMFFADEDVRPYLTPSYYTFAGLVLATIILVPPRFRRLAAPPTASASAAALPKPPDVTDR